MVAAVPVSVSPSFMNLLSIVTKVMDMEVTLQLDEIREAIQKYLQEEKDMKVDQDDISFDVRKGSMQPRSSGTPRLRSATCENVETLSQ